MHITYYSLFESYINTGLQTIIYFIVSKKDIIIMYVNTRPSHIFIFSSLVG